MLTESQIERYGYGNERIFYDLENQLMEDIVRRIKKTGEITSTADYQIMQLKALGLSNYEITEQIKKALNESDEYVYELYREAMKNEWYDAKDIYAGMGQAYVKFEDNAFIQNLIGGAFMQTSGEMVNMTGTMGFVVGGKSVELSKFYRDTMDNAISMIMGGGFDYNTVLKKAIKQMTNSGIRWINYESGWHNRITVAARRSVMTGLSQMTRGITEDTAKRLNTDTFEVSAHAGARPDHAKWQGGIFTKKQLYEICGLGTVNGLLGANCYHTYYPYIKGISKRAYTDEQLKAWRNDTPKMYKGKEYTQYQAQQRMRQMETNMRAQRQTINLLKIGGADKETITEERIKYRIQMQQYKDIAKFFRLKEQKERIYLDGLGRV